MAEDYEGDFLSRRAIIYTLDFELRVRFYGPVKEQAIITVADADLLQGDLNDFGFVEEIVADGTGGENNINTGVDTTDDGAITT